MQKYIIVVSLSSLCISCFILLLFRRFNERLFPHNILRKMIRNKVVSRGSTLKVPGHLSIGKYFLERLMHNCENEGDAVAMVNGNTGEQIYYKQLLQHTVNIAVGLKQQGVKKGDVIAFYAESRHEIMSGVMGAICCGAAVTIFNILYTKDELQRALNISKPRIVFCSKTALETNFKVFKEAEFIERIVLVNGDPIEDGVLSLSDVMGYIDPKDYEPEAVSGATDTVLILYSSGTTGLPKGVMLTHLNILYVWSTLDSGYYAVTASHRILTVLPWYHVFGLITTVHYLTWHKQVVYITGFNPDKYLSTIQKYKVHCLFVVPPIIVTLAKSDLVEKYDVSSVICIWCGAAPLSPTTADMIAKRFPNVAKLIQGYGMTEATLVVMKEIDEPGAEPGYLPVPGCKVKIVDIVTGKKLGHNENGEICVKSPSLMKGYVDDDAATNAAFDEEGYLKTGDIGYYDEKGYFSIIDRLKEVINYKGHKVAPAEIENVILQHESVADCGVVGRPDEEAIELPTAFVVVKQGYKLTEKDLLEYTTAKLSPLARLRGGIIFLDEIPKSPTGKILRRVLKKKLD